VLQILSSLSALALVVILQMAAMMSVSADSERYFWFAALVILLWGQLFSLSDPYRTDRSLLRVVTYLGFFLASIALAYIFARWQPYLIAAAAFGLGLLEMLVRRRVMKKFKETSAG
jgi:hypothetical protein